MMPASRTINMFGWLSPISDCVSRCCRGPSGKARKWQQVCWDCCSNGCHVECHFTSSARKRRQNGPDQKGPGLSWFHVWQQKAWWSRLPAPFRRLYRMGGLRMSWQRQMDEQRNGRRMQLLPSSQLEWLPAAASRSTGGNDIERCDYRSSEMKTFRSSDASYLNFKNKSGSRLISPPRGGWNWGGLGVLSHHI